MIIEVPSATSLEQIRHEVAAALPYRVEGSGELYFVVRKRFMVAATVGRLPSGQISVEGTYGSTLEALLALVFTIVGLIVIPRIVLWFVVNPKQREVAEEVARVIADSSSLVHETLA